MRRFYVSLTWEDWPDGGSYGTSVCAHNETEAEERARDEMVLSRLSDLSLCRHCGQPDFHSKNGFCGNCADRIQSGERVDDTDKAVDTVMSKYSSQWHLVDCFDIDAFISDHSNLAA